MRQSPKIFFICVLLLSTNLYAATSILTRPIKRIAASSVAVLALSGPVAASGLPDYSSPMAVVGKPLELGTSSIHSSLGKSPFQNPGIMEEINEVPFSINFKPMEGNSSLSRAIRDMREIAGTKDYHYSDEVLEFPGGGMFPMDLELITEIDAGNFVGIEFDNGRSFLVPHAKLANILAQLRGLNRSQKQ